MSTSHFHQSFFSSPEYCFSSKRTVLVLLTVINVHVYHLLKVQVNHFPFSKQQDPKAGTVVG